MAPKSAAVKAALRVAVVGAGSIGREYALHHFGSHTGTQVASIVDLDTSAAQALARDVGAAQAGAAIVGRNRYKSVVSDAKAGDPVRHAAALTDEVLDDCSVVYIGVTPSAHKDLVLRALEAGKHVLLEKPLASTAADADAIVAAAAAAETRGTWLAMNIGMRWNAALQEMRNQVRREREQGGCLLSASLSLHFVQWPREWQQVAWCAGRADGGPLRECGTHYLAAVNELFGVGSVKRVRATVTYPDGPDGSMAESGVEGELTLSDGLIVTVSVKTDGTGLAADGDDHYNLELETQHGGTLLLSDFTALRRRAHGGARRWKTLVDRGEYGRTECVTTLCERIHCGRAAGGGQSDERVTARDGREVQRVLDALLASGGEWVDLDVPA